MPAAGGLKTTVDSSRVQAALALEQRKARVDDGQRVTVGYSIGYATYVHENMEARHKVGQAKFLESPARKMKSELAGIVRTALRRGASMAQALLLAGFRLQRASQLLTPVDTGALRSSAFTKVEGKGR